MSPVDFRGLHRIASENLLSGVREDDPARARRFLVWAKENGEAARRLASNPRERALADGLLATAEDVAALIVDA